MDLRKDTQTFFQAILVLLVTTVSAAVVPVVPLDEDGGRFIRSANPNPDPEPHRGYRYYRPRGRSFARRRGLGPVGTAVALGGTAIGAGLLGAGIANLIRNGK